MLKQIIDVFKSAPGAISVTEGMGIYHFIRQHLQTEKGIVADLGSHAGKSSMFAALAFKNMGHLR